MTNVAISPTRALRVLAHGRSRVLVPIQPVPRLVTIIVAGPGSCFVSPAADHALRARPELPDQAEIPAGVRVPMHLAAGEGRWCITDGAIVPVMVQIEYLWDQDPQQAIDSYKLVQAAQDYFGYDEIADRNFDGLLCNDPFRRMVAAQSRARANQDARDALEGGS